MRNGYCGAASLLNPPPKSVGWLAYGPCDV